MCQKHSVADRFLWGDDCTLNKCRICRYEVYKNNYAQNKERILDRQKKNKPAYRERIRNLKATYGFDPRIKNQEEIKKTKMYIMLEELLIKIRSVESEFRRLGQH